MVLAELPADALEAVAEFLEVSVTLDWYWHRDRAVWEVRMTCGRLSRDFRARPPELSIEGTCEESCPRLLSAILRAVDLSRVSRLSLSFLDEACLLHVLGACPSLQTLELVSMGDAVRRRPHVLLMPSLRHLFVNELPSRALAAELAKRHRALRLFAWNAETDPWWDCGDASGWDDLQDADLLSLAPLVDQRLAQEVFPGRERLYDLSFEGVTVAGRSSFCKECEETLSVLRLGDVLVYAHISDTLQAFLAAGVRTALLELYDTRMGGVDEIPLVRVLKRPGGRCLLTLRTHSQTLFREYDAEVARFVAHEIQDLIYEGSDLRGAVAEIMESL